VVLQSKAYVCRRLIPGWWVRNPLIAWEASWSIVFAVCCVGSGVCDELIICSEKTYRVSVSNCMGFRNLKNEASKGRVGLAAQKFNYMKWTWNIGSICFSIFMNSALNPCHSETHSLPQARNNCARRVVWRFVILSRNSAKY